MYNEEYTTLSVISFGIYVVFGVLQIMVYGNYRKRKKYVNLLSYNFYSIFSYFSSGYICYILIHTEASMKNSLMKNTENYVSGYIKRANYLGIIKDEDIEKVKRN